MNPEQQRIAIAEACGWTNFREEAHTTITYLWAITPTGERDIVPDYLSDLNAMHKAEKGINSEQQTRYYWSLAKLLLGDEVPLNCTFVLIHATSSQRAEAFLRTLNLWKD